MSMQVSKAQAELKDAASRVAATAALPQWSARAAGSLQADSSSMRPGYQTLWDQAQMRLPTLRAAQAELDQAQQKIKLEEQLRACRNVYWLCRIAILLECLGDC